MILHHIILGLLLYLQTITSHPVEILDNQNPIPSMDMSTLSEINGLTEPINDSFSDIDVDSLITKVVELSKKYKNDMNGTVEDIQQMIQTDNSLPRLTRGEIVDLLENLTKTNPESWKDKIKKSRSEYQRAVMLVMPYSPKNYEDFNIEELYTKPPITHIVGTESVRPVSRKPQSINKHVEMLHLEPSTQRPILVKRPTKPLKSVKPVQESSQEIKNYPQEQKPRIKVNATTNKSVQKPVRFSNHRYTDDREVVTPNSGMKIISAPNLAPKPEGFKRQPLQNKESVKDKQEIKSIEKPLRNVRPMQSSVYKAPITSTSRPRVRSTTTTTSTTTQSPISIIDVPQEMKDAVKDVNFGKIEPYKPYKFSSQYDGSLANFQKYEQDSENIKDIFVLPQQTTTPVPGVSEVADLLSPDMRDLLMSFGLIEDPNKPRTEPSTTVKFADDFDSMPYSYTRFKPLPDDAPTRSDMEEFLAGFGLVGNSKRSSKKLETPEEPLKMPLNLTEVPNINMEIIPESMHSVLEDIGLVENEPKLIGEESQETHVFNPEQTYISQGELKRLNQLMDTIKRLEKLNRTATIEDLKDLDIENIKELTKILKEDASKPLDEQNFGPDPLDFDVSPEKNEVKRQENTTTTEKPTTEKVEAKYPSLAALEESFGGNAGSSSETVDESLPPPRNTGFYYLVDWNSFLEVGEEGKNKVNVQFSPKAGDPSRFLRIN